MKKVLQMFAVVIAIGAVAQTLKAYTMDDDILSEEAEVKIIQLIEMRRAIKAQGEEVVLQHPSIQAEFPGIRTSKDLNDNLSGYIRIYLDKINGENGLNPLLPKKKGNIKSQPDEPGV